MTTTKPATKKKPTCTGPGCARPAPAGLCPAHRRQLTRGKPLTPLKTRPPKPAPPTDPAPAPWVPGTLWPTLHQQQQKPGPAKNVDPATLLYTNVTTDTATRRAAWAALCHHADPADLPELADALGLTTLKETP